MIGKLVYDKSQDAHFKLAFYEGKGPKNIGQKEPEDETQMENRCNLTLKTNFALLIFSVNILLWDRNTPIHRVYQRIAGKMTLPWIQDFIPQQKNTFITP